MSNTDRKSEVSFKCLVDLLPSPPVTKVKRPRLSAEAILDYFFIDFEVRLFYSICSVSDFFFKFAPLLYYT